MFLSLSVCLSVCLLASLCKKFQMDLHEIFSGTVGNRPVIKWLNFGGDSDHGSGSGYESDPGHYTCKTCLGRGMHCSSASSFICVDPRARVNGRQQNNILYSLQFCWYYTADSRHGASLRTFWYRVGNKSAMNLLIKQSNSFRNDLRQLL